MKKILVASTNEKVINTVKASCQKYAAYFDPMFFPDTDEALSYIDYELPEIKVLDFTSKADIDANRILAEIHTDPWLHNGGIIAVVSKSSEAQELEEKKDSNILIVQTVHSFVENFSRLLRILWSNQQFLFNRGIQERIGGRETGAFVCGNDPLDIRVYTNFLVSYLYSTNRIGGEDRYKLQTTLMELLTNALEHGNCKISYDEKTQWLENGGNILDLIREKTKDPEIANKKVHISYIVGKEKSRFKIRDDGEGFDWKARLNADFSEETHGRGMKLSESMVTSLTYNDKGNEVTFEVMNQQNAANTVPGIMQPFSTVAYKDKQVVCRENDNTNDLFFIVSGRYAVYTNRKLVSVLTPNDMFIGEMSFLLNDRRSATILSVGDGRLIKIPKVSFLNLIRKNPHYGIFLSKLLAQRLLKQTMKTLQLASDLAELKEHCNISDTFED
ncbi:MAG TPA: cyclic nucleotide-binding domain-containing protein [Treponemataceae bacterium]|jgi:anti-sigma regulatory factor (Ser/Thr protein kinase)|nr:cyclic nucleotide-binding domain-containing protein [Treponemataceae bacterium]HOS29843.1 cyclic nucleotide-binding domain-containing protein [Treponemataceae bacterium]HQL04189.1 cyclic nucleotide-binding domain-containing protein [Treponemataceae bacterium]